MEKCVNFIVKNNLGDLSSFLGLLIVIIGFFFTIKNVLKSKKASELAKKAAIETKKRIDKYDFITECSEAIGIMGEIKRLQKTESWQIISDRYSVLRRLLISLRNSTQNLKIEEKIKLQDMVIHMRNAEDIIDYYNIKKDNPPKNIIINLNKVISIQLDKLHDIQASFKQEIE